MKSRGSEPPRWASRRRGGFRWRGRLVERRADLAEALAGRVVPEHALAPRRPTHGDIHLADEGQIPPRGLGMESRGQVRRRAWTDVVLDIDASAEGQITAPVIYPFPSRDRGATPGCAPSRLDSVLVASVRFLAPVTLRMAWTSSLTVATEIPSLSEISLFV